MSAAEPMTPYQRAARYDLRFTPRQRRRYLHKANRNQRIGMLATSDNAKDWPTPKQKRSITP
jgi:hypothetical protein